MSKENDYEGRLTNLPGQIADPAVRDLIRQLRHSTVTPKQLLETVMNGGTDDQLKVAAYVSASNVIAQLFEFLGTYPTVDIFSMLGQKHSFTSFEECAQTFAAYCITTLDQLEERFVAAVKERIESSGSDIDAPDHLFACFVLSERGLRPDEKGMPIPSANDLIVMFARMAALVPIVFERDVGRKPVPAEIYAMLRHPSMMRFFAETMMNSREKLFPLISLLENVAEGNLNDTKRFFNPDLFEIRFDHERPTLRIKSDVVSKYRKTLDASTQVVAYGCPALYSGVFREMCDWLCDVFEAWCSHTTWPL